MTMSINAIFDVAGSAMSAQSIRLNTVASNLANAQTASSSTGQTYRARHPVFAPLYRELTGSVANEAQAGVQVLGIVESDAPLQPRYEPDHPLADARGYVYYPNVNVVVEELNAMEAVRNYEANAAAVEATRAMINTALQMIG